MRYYVRRSSSQPSLLVVEHLAEDGEILRIERRSQDELIGILGRLETELHDPTAVRVDPALFSQTVVVVG